MPLLIMYEVGLNECKNKTARGIYSWTICSVLSTSLSSWKMHDITIGTDVDLIYLDSIACVMPHSAT